MFRAEKAIFRHNDLKHLEELLNHSEIGTKLSCLNRLFNGWRHLTDCGNCRTGAQI